jgi:branched-chain amino acid transport system permease protein
MSDFLSYTVNGLTLGSMYALIALGYTLVYGVLQLINFAHSEVFMSGAFGSYLLVHAMVGDNAHVAVAMVILTLVAGAVAAAVSGGSVAWLLERVAYRPLRKRGAPKLAFLISAIGASFFLSAIAGKVFNRQPNNTFPEFFNVNATIVSIGTARVRLIQLIIVVTAIVMMLFLDRLVAKTKLGRSVRAVAEDAPTAALMGVNIDKTISRTFVIGGMLGGLAGFLFGMAFNFSYTMGFQPGTAAFTAAVLGGIGNIRGAMLGGLTLGLVVSWMPLLDKVPWLHDTGLFTTKWTDVVAFVVLVLVLMFRPTGILGERLARAA